MYSRSRPSELPLLRALISDIVSDLKGFQQTYTLRFSHSLSEPALCLTWCIVDRASSLPPVSFLGDYTLLSVSIGMYSGLGNSVLLLLGMSP